MTTAENEPKIVFTKVSERGFKRSRKYRGPRNAHICVGINNLNSEIRVAYASLGGRQGHSDLLPVVSPTNDFVAVRARLLSEGRNKAAEHILAIYYPEDRRKDLFYVNPQDVLDENILDQLCHKMGAQKYLFTKG